jgi:hypothetical protein
MGCGLREREYVVGTVHRSRYITRMFGSDQRLQTLIVRMVPSSCAQYWVYSKWRCSLYKGHIFSERERTIETRPCQSNLTHRSAARREREIENTRSLAVKKDVKKEKRDRLRLFRET